MSRLCHEVKLDFNDTVFIVDSAISALIVSIIAQNNNIHCIIENKDGFDSEYANIQRLILGKTKFLSLDVINVPNPFFLLNSREPLRSCKRLIEFRKKMDKIKLPAKKYFVGAATSSIIKSLNVSIDNIWYMDHGTGDYYTRMSAGKSSIKAKIIDILLKIFGLPNIACKERSRGFTLCKMNNDYFTWLDYQKYDFEETSINNMLLPLKSIVKQQQNAVLFLPRTDFHSEKGVDGNTTLFDDINMKLIQRHIKQDETIFVKFHPSLEMADNITIDLISKVRKLGYQIFNVTEFISYPFAGFIPVEIIVQCCGLKKVVGVESSCLWNLSADDSMKLILDNSNLIDAQHGKIIDCIDNLCEHRVTIVDV